jgi:hypothetical protein
MAILHFLIVTALFGTATIAFPVVPEGNSGLQDLKPDLMKSFLQGLRKLYSFANYPDKLLKDSGFSYESVHNDQLLATLMNTKLMTEQNSGQHNMASLGEKDFNQESYYFFHIYLVLIVQLSAIILIPILVGIIICFRRRSRGGFPLKKVLNADTQL